MNFSEYNFHWSHLSNKSNPDSFDINDWYVADPQCPLNKREVPEGSMPLNEIFELYAKDQNAWITDFVPAFEKMLSNGYDDLSDGPNQFDGVICNRGPRTDAFNYTNCYNSQVLNGPSYMIISKIDGRALHALDNGKAQMRNFNANALKQRWVFSGVGDQLINVKTGLPLFAGENLGSGRSWILDDQQRLVDSRDGTMALERNPNQGDYAAVVIRKIGNADRQKWTLVPVEK